MAPEKTEWLQHSLRVLSYKNLQLSIREMVRSQHGYHMTLLNRTNCILSDNDLVDCILGGKWTVIKTDHLQLSGLPYFKAITSKDPFNIRAHFRLPHDTPDNSPEITNRQEQIQKWFGGLYYNEDDNTADQWQPPTIKQIWTHLLEREVSSSPEKGFLKNPSFVKDKREGRKTTNAPLLTAGVVTAFHVIFLASLFSEVTEELRNFCNNNNFYPAKQCHPVPRPMPNPNESLSFFQNNICVFTNHIAHKMRMHVLKRVLHNSTEANSVYGKSLNVVLLGAISKNVFQAINYYGPNPMALTPDDTQQVSRRLLDTW